MGNLKEYSAYTSYTGASASISYPQVSYVDDKNKVFFTHSNYMVVTYNVTSTTESTRVLGENFNLSQVSTMLVDGKKIDSPFKEYTFNTSGIHKVRVIFNPSFTDATDILYDTPCYVDKYIDKVNLDQILTNKEDLINGGGSKYNIIATYNVSSTTEPTTLMFKNKFLTMSRQITDMTIDDEIVSVRTTHTFTTTGNHVVKYAVPKDTFTDANEMFHSCSTLVSLDVSRLNTSNVTSMSWMFNYCSSLTSLDLSNFDTSNVTNMSLMFQDCFNLTSLNLSNFDTSKVDYMSEMFDLCWSLASLDLSNFNTSNVTSMSHMFRECKSLTSLDVSNFNTSNVTDMSGMFEDCEDLTSLDVSHFNTSAVTDMSWMFWNCNELTSLDVSNFDTSAVTDMSYMFYDCASLTSLDVSNFDTSAVTNMGWMFRGCYGLTSLDLSNFDTSNVTDMSEMFYGCNGLTSLDLSNFDTSNVTDMGGMFWGCYSLTSLILNGGLNSSLNVASMFDLIKTFGTLHYDPIYDYSKIVNVLPNTWVVSDGNIIQECTDLSINANDVEYYETYSKLTYNATCNIYNLIYKTINEGVIITGNGHTNIFSENTQNESVTISVSYTYFGYTATTTIQQSGKPAGGYTINTNSQWQLSSTISNPDSSLYEGVYESFSNKGVNNSIATMTVTITGYSEFTVYVRSYAESNYDYVMVSQLDTNLTSASTASTYMKASTSGKQNSNTALTAYTKVVFTGMDKGIHTITIGYRKDSSQHTGDDRGYLLIPKQSTSDRLGEITATIVTTSQGETVDILSTNFDISQVYDISVNGELLPTPTTFIKCPTSGTYNISYLFKPNTLTDCQSMFQGCDKIKSINILNIRNQNVTDMGNMFEACTSLTSLNLQGINTSNVTDMSFMFSGCTNLTTLDVSPLNTSNVTDMRGMFSYCERIKVLNIAHFNLTKVTSFNSTFGMCYSLTSITMPTSSSTSAVTDVEGMFCSCSGLSTINLSGCTFKNVTIATHAFTWCNALTKLYLCGNVPSSIDATDMFCEVTSTGTLYIPSSYATSSGYTAIKNALPSTWTYTTYTNSKS